MHGHARVVALLLDGKYEGQGADINLPEESGYTPLMSALFDSHEAVVRLLLQRGADATLRNKAGMTALSLVRRRQQTALVALLQAHGATE